MANSVYVRFADGLKYVGRNSGLDELIKDYALS